MTKKFCDRCGKEAEKLNKVKMSFGNAGYPGGGYKQSAVELCEDCQKETGIFDFIQKNSYKETIEEPSEQDKFFELFRNMISCAVQDMNS